MAAIASEGTCLLDTDTYSEIRRGVHLTVAARSAAYLQAKSRFTIASITVAEIVQGFHRVGREDRLTDFIGQLAHVEVLPFDTGAAMIAGRLNADLRRIGRPIGWADPLIAAIALHHNLTLVTGNTDHYARIQALGYPLRLNNWREP